MKTWVMIRLAFGVVLLVAFAGAALQLAKGQRPILFRLAPR
jgi:hypothetical protein